MNNFSTKQKGDIAEYRVIAELLKQGFNVLIPCGDRLRYDLAIDKDGRLIRIQVKQAWYYEKSRCHIVDIRRSQTNRVNSLHTKYCEIDFDFLITWLPDLDVFYVFPSQVACTYSSNINMVEGRVSQRDVKSKPFRNNWELIQ